MKKSLVFFLFISVIWALPVAASLNNDTASFAGVKQYEPISLAGFADGIHHWRNRYGSNYATYSPEQIVEIAENLLFYQHNNGGWTENRDPSRILSKEEREKIIEEKEKAATSFDNRNTYTQVEYLAAVYNQTGDIRYRDASLNGLNFILSQQYASGGWPHTIPGTEKYHSYVTIADEVMPGILTTLRKVAEKGAPFAFIDPTMQEKARKAVEMGDECLLKLQVIQNGVLTGWAGQYDNNTLTPAMGRSYELPSIVSWETVGVLHYLMSIKNPSPEVINSVESAVAWLERSKILGIRLETFKAESEKYSFHTANTDRRVVEDPNAPPIWARFYDLETNEPVLANRDSIRVHHYSEIARERRTGYAWYGYWPEKLLKTNYPQWKARIGLQ